MFKVSPRVTRRLVCGPSYYSRFPSYLQCPCAFTVPINSVAVAGGVHTGCQKPDFEVASLAYDSLATT